MFEIFGTGAELEPKITGRSLIRALNYWREIAGERRAPLFHDFDPMAVPEQLPTTFVLTAGPGDDFVYLLAGTKIEEKLGMGGLKGKSPGDILGDNYAPVRDIYRRVKTETLPYYRTSDTAWLSPTETYCRNEVLLLPLSEDGETVSMILGIQEFSRRPAALRAQQILAAHL